MIWSWHCVVIGWPQAVSLPVLSLLTPFLLYLHLKVIIILQVNMIRQSITRPLVTANRALCQRSFSVAVPRLGEGDTGAPRAGGAASEYVEYLLETSPYLLVAAVWLSALTACLVFRHMTTPIADILAQRPIHPPRSRPGSPLHP